MKRFLLLFLLGLFAPAIKSQTNSQFLFVTVAPAGACANRAQPRYLVPNGTIYTCASNVWALDSGSGGGGANVVLAVTPGLGLAHFAGGTQTVTSSAVVGADFGAAIAARSSLQNATAAAAAPTFSTTDDVLAYQVAEIPSQVEVCSAGGTGCAAGAFTTSGVGTALEAITGLGWTFPANTALNIPFECYIIYHQNVATANVNFGYQNATVAQTNLAVQGVFNTSATTSTQQNLVGSAPAAGTSTNIFAAATPSAITTNWNVYFQGYIEQPSNGSASVFSIRVSTATAADTVTIVRGSYCHQGVA